MATLKYSRQREEIKQYLMGRTDHPTAEAIYSALREIDPKISLGTVYRNLSLLSELGEIRKIATEIGPDHFDGNAAPHYHFVCRQCQQMTDISMPVEHDLTREVMRSADGEVDSVELVAYGVCRSCGGKHHTA